MDLTGFATESGNQNTIHLDTMTPLEVVTIMNEEDNKVVAAVETQLPAIAKVAEWGSDALYNDGRIIYMGAGTSGRLGVLDAVECPPTFGVSHDTVVGLIAGGQAAFVEAVEGAEDREDLGRHDLIQLDLREQDLVIGIAASGRTPYVIGGLKYAQEVGCKTASIACNEHSEIGLVADIAIEAVPGAEVLTGSTRLKAGTAQKMILNMISTTAMIGYGKVYHNLMVDVKQSNAKLKVRAQNIVMTATDVDRDTAIQTLAMAGGSVKTAIVMILWNCSQAEALLLLKQAQGHIKNIKNNDEETEK